MHVDVERHNGAVVAAGAEDSADAVVFGLVDFGDGEVLVKELGVA